MKNKKTAAIILAAGASSRMGVPKPLVKWQGQPFIAHVIKAANTSKLSPIHVVIGAHKNKVLSELKNEDVKIIENEQWQDGLSSSVKKGIESLPNATEEVLILLVDQPHVEVELINELKKKSASSNADMFIPTKNERKGNPILIKSSCYHLISELKGDQGFRQIFDKVKIELVEWKNDSIFIDIDTPKDKTHLKKFQKDAK